MIRIIMTRPPPTIPIQACHGIPKKLNLAIGSVELSPVEFVGVGDDVVDTDVVDAADDDTAAVVVVPAADDGVGDDDVDVDGVGDDVDVDGVGDDVDDCDVVADPVVLPPVVGLAIPQIGAAVESL